MKHCLLAGWSPDLMNLRISLINTERKRETKATSTLICFKFFSLHTNPPHSHPKDKAVRVLFWKLQRCFLLQMGRDTGDADVDTFPDWSHPSHVTIFQKKTTLSVSWMYVSVSHDYLLYFDMDSKLQELQLLPLPAAVVRINSAFYHQATTAYMLRRKDAIQQTVTVSVFSGTISPTLIGTTLSME